MPVDEDGPTEPASVESPAADTTPKVKKQIELVAQIVQHIPDVHEKSVIYYGWYSNRTRGKRRAEAAEQNAQIEDAFPGDDPKPSEPQAPAAVRRAWAAMIKRIYEVDPLKCPECGGEMYIVSFIDNEDVIYKILKHLDLLDKDQGEGGIQVRGSPEAGAAQSRSA